MYPYIARRLLASLFALFLVSIAVAALIRLVPGDAAIQRIAEASSAKFDAATLAQIRADLGIDRPFYAQYFSWIGGVFRGDFGTSYTLQGVSVASLLKHAYPISLQLAIMAVVIALLAAIPLGVLSATRQDSWVDYGGRLVAILGLSIPDFVWGTLLIIYLAVWFDYTPPFVFKPFFTDPRSNLQMTIIPASILGLRFSASAMRMIRSSTLEVLREDYVRTARAKGLRERVVIYRHVLKNAFIPVITILGSLFGYLVGGTVIVESIFNLPGMGRLTLEGIAHRDYPIVQTIVLLTAAVVVLMNLLVDLSYGWLDPRISYR